MNVSLVTAALRDKLVAVLPPAYSIEDMRVMTCTAQLATTPGDIGTVEAALIQAAVEAGPPLVNADNKPTILRVSAWLAHGDIPNRNRDAFVKEELAAVAPTLFRAPNFGVMDFNHSAVRFFAEDPKVLGVWYKAEYAFDEAANKGQGAWGVLATGMLFAWAYPEFATRLLGEQARDGYVSFSMACIPGGTEFKTDVEGTYAVLHNPVFFTLSALDVPPADPDAVGAVTETTVETEADIQRRLAETRKPVAKASQEAVMTPEQISTLEAERQTALDRAEALASQNVIARTEAETAAGKLATIETKLAETETQRDALATERDTLVAKVSALETEVVELKGKVETFESAQAATATAARLATRIAGLPVEFQQAHSAKSDESRARMDVKWAAMSDEEWTVYVTDELLAYAGKKVGFVVRSAAEGVLPVTTPQDEFGIGARAAALIKH